MRAARWKLAGCSNRKMDHVARQTCSSRHYLDLKTAPRNSLMLLVIDAGNTNITLGVFQGADLLVQWRLSTEHQRTADEYGVQARKLFELAAIDFKQIEAIVIASVVPALNETLKRMTEVYFELAPVFIDHTTDTGLK